MSVTKNDDLRKLIADEKALEDSNNSCSTIQGIHCDCKDENLIALVLSLIGDVQTLTAGEYIRISDNRINVNVGQGLKNDGSNNIAIDYGSLPLATPVLLNSIQEYNNDKSSLLRTLTANSVAIEDGAKIDVNSKFKYVLGSNYSQPTSITGDYGSLIPADNTYSNPLAISDYQINNGNLLKTVTFERAKSGLNVVDGKVVAPTGVDNTSVSLSISINYPFYLGYSSSTPSSIGSFTKKLSLKSGSLTYTGVTSGVSNYTYFLFPNDVTVTNIIMDGAAPVLGAFSSISNISITTETGVTRTVKVLKSNALGAFNNNTLRFDFTL